MDLDGVALGSFFDDTCSIDGQVSALQLDYKSRLDRFASRELELESKILEHQQDIDILCKHLLDYHRENRCLRSIVSQQHMELDSVKRKLACAQSYVERILADKVREVAVLDRKLKEQAQSLYQFQVMDAITSFYASMCLRSHSLIYLIVVLGTLFYSSE